MNYLRMLLERMLRKVAVPLNEGEALCAPPSLAIYYIKPSSRTGHLVHKGEHYYEYDRYVLMRHHAGVYSRLLAWMPRANVFQTWKHLRF